MAIVFACQCGKPLQAAEQYSGRKMRCPSCGSILTIPSDSGMQATEPPELNLPEAATQVPRTVSAATMTPAEPASPPPAKATPPEVAKRDADAAEVPIAEESGDSADQVADEEVPVVAAPPLPPPIRKKTKEAKKAVSVYNEDSLSQEITPWPEHDKTRIGEVLEAERSGGGRWFSILILLLLVGTIAAGWIFRSGVSNYLRMYQ